MSDLLVGSVVYASFTLLTLLLVMLNKRMTYWRRRGISHQLPNLIFGNLLGVRGKRSLLNIFHQMYEKFKGTGELFCGFYWLTEPAVFVLDKELTNKILTRDFKYFSLKTPVTMSFFMKSAEFEEEIIKASLKAKELLKGSLEDCNEKEVNIQLISKRYMEKVYTEMFSQKEGTKNCKRNTALNQKWIYIFQQFYSKKCESLNSLENYFNISATLLCCIFYELANDDFRQQKLYENILFLLQRTGNKFTSKCLKENAWLERQVTDVFYRYIPFSHVILRAFEDYSTIQTGYTIEKGSLVILPIAAMDQNYQNDANYDCFQRNHLATIVFGDSGLFLIYTALFLILRDYQFHCSVNTPEKLTFRETLQCKTIETAVYLKITKR